MPKDFKVQRLSDEFGQYLLVIKCAGCAHERRAYLFATGTWQRIKERLRSKSVRRVGLARLTRRAGRVQGRTNSPARRRKLGCQARGFGEAIALFEVRKEKLPHSRD